MITTANTTRFNHDICALWHGARTDPEDALVQTAELADSDVERLNPPLSAGHGAVHV